MFAFGIHVCLGVYPREAPGNLASLFMAGSRVTTDEIKTSEAEEEEEAISKLVKSGNGLPLSLKLWSPGQTLTMLININ